MLKIFKNLHRLNLSPSNCLVSSINPRTSSKLSKNIKLAYESYGKSTTKVPLVILHGLLGSKNNWKSMSKALHANTGGRQIVCVDARNHGDSPHDEVFSYPAMAEDIYIFLKQTKLAPAILMGHSMGGRTAMLTALNYPLIVKSLIVVDISPIGISPSIFTLPRLFEAIKQVQVRSGMKLSEARAIANKQLSERVPETYLRQFILSNLTRDANGTIRWKINIDAIERNFLDNITKFPFIKKTSIYEGPTLFIAGSQSDYIARSDESAIKKIFPKAKFTYIPKSGHYVHGDQPILFMNAVTEFINKI